MGIWDKLRGELVDIIEWLDDSPDTLVWRFPRYENEIKNGAQLIVRPGQVAALVNEGAMADVFATPGTYTLNTRNVPILATIRGWKYGFESPFKAEVYFVSTRTFTGRKWGTKNPIIVEDPKFGPVRLRAFGSFAIKVTNPATFLTQIVGTNSNFTIDGIGEQLRNLVVARFADALGESNIPVLKLAGNSDELGKFVTGRIKDDFAQFGLEVVQLLVENISLPPEVEQALDKRSSMGIIGDLGQYTQFQAATAMEKAAENPGGAGAAGIGMGMGFGMANQMGQAFANQARPSSDATPPPVGSTAGGSGTPPPLQSGPAWFVARDGKQAGPFELADVQDGIRMRQIAADTLIWKKGMAQWTRAAEVAEFRDLVNELPPPLPPG